MLQYRQEHDAQSTSQRMRSNQCTHTPPLTHPDTAQRVRGLMDKHFGTTIVGGDKAKALGDIEPLHLANTRASSSLGWGSSGGCGCRRRDTRTHASTTVRGHRAGCHAREAAAAPGRHPRDVPLNIRASMEARMGAATGLRRARRMNDMVGTWEMISAANSDRVRTAEHQKGRRPK